MQISTEAGSATLQEKIGPQQLRREHPYSDTRWLLQPRLAGPAAESRHTNRDGR